MQKIHFIIKGRVNYSHSIVHAKNKGYSDLITLDDDV